MKGNSNCPHCHGSGWYGDSTSDGDEPCNSPDVRNDPDEARLPECVQRWRAAKQFHGVDKDYGQPKGHRIQLDNGDFVEEDGGRHSEGAAAQAAILSLDWLATAPPAAILLAASAADAEVLRAGVEQWQRGAGYGLGVMDAMVRARIVSADDYVCLPRAEVETLLEKWDRSVPGGDCAAQLRALLAAETGKGEKT